MLQSFSNALASASKFIWGLFGHREMRIMMTGPRQCGKTTLLYKLKLNEIVKTIGTIGFNVETIKYANTSFTMWDMGSSSQHRSIRSHYFQNTQGLIYVVDSTSPESLEDARQRLYEDLNEPALAKTPLLVYANKQDLPGAISTEKIADILELEELEDRMWHIQASSVIKGEGLYEGLAWLAAKYRERREPSVHIPKSH